MKHLKSKISKVLVIYIVLFSSVITLILTAIQLRLDYKDGVKFIHQRINQVKLTNIDSITQSLWTLDHSSIQIQLDGLSRINDIIFVKITSHNDELIAAAGEINTKNTITESITLSQKYRDKDTYLGTLTIIATKENIYQQLLDTVIVILISQAIKTFLVSIFILFLFYYLVTRHLEKIAEYSAKLELSSKSEPLVLQRTKFKKYHDDELKRVVDSINRMSNNMYAAYYELILNQKELSEREAKFSAIYDAISDAVVLVDIDRQIIQTNPAFISQFGYSFEELKGHTTHMLYANSDEYGTQGKQRYNPNAHPNTSLYDIEYRRKDGSTFPSETLGAAITLPDGTQIGFIGIIRDISARILAEKQEQKLQKRLQQSQKIEAIGQLTGGIAHDFNNILASILGYSELSMMALEKYNDESLNDYINQIILAGERARDLVAQMLSFSRSNPGEPQLIELPNLIKEVVSLLRPTIPSSIELLTEIDDQVPPVLMDNTQMHQMLMNLCINARDSMKNDGTLTVKLSYVSSADDICTSCKDIIEGEYVKLSIKDTGEGIKPDVLETIFEPFVSTKEVGKGTGMGLSVVHGILHKHNSHIVVESELNSGSSFHLFIPPLKEINMTTSHETKNNKKILNNGNQKHILVVDDEESIAIFLQELLRRYNYKVTYTTSSKHALEIFKASTSDIDLIITDQTMPELSGTEMVKQMFEVKPNIPVVLCSGYSENIDEKSALDLGCIKYMEKPINSKKMIQALHDILGIK